MTGVWIDVNPYSLNAPLYLHSVRMKPYPNCSHQTVIIIYNHF